MKKIIFICVALVVALGGLGIGYAMWYDKITVNGTVTTGCVNSGHFTVKSAYAYKALKAVDLNADTSVVKNPLTDNRNFAEGAAFFREVEKAEDVDPSRGTDPADTMYLGGVEAKASTIGAKTITLNFNNVFPTYDTQRNPYQLAAVITYTYGADCNIPVHLDIRNMKDPCDVLLLDSGKGTATNKDVLRTDWTVLKPLSETTWDEANPVKKIEGKTWKDLRDTPNPLQGIQLHPNYKVIIKVYLDSDALQAADRFAGSTGAQGLTGATGGAGKKPCTFSFDLIVHQWNEIADLTNIPLPKTVPTHQP